MSDTIEVTYPWKIRKSLREHIENFYHRFSVSETYGVSEEQVRRLVKEIQTEVEDPTFCIEYTRSHSAVHFSRPASEEAYIHHSCVNLAVVEVELEKEKPDFDIGWSHMLEAFRHIQRLEDEKLRKMGRLLIRANKEPKEIDENTPHRLIKEKLLELIDGDLKPLDGWSSFKQLAHTVSEGLDEFCKINNIDLKSDNWQRNIETWIRRYRPLREAYERSRTPCDEGK